MEEVSTHEFKVEMTCEGCAGTVKRVLEKLGDQILKVRIDVPVKRVFVTTQMPVPELLEVIKKTGLETSYIG